MNEVRHNSDKEAAKAKRRLGFMKGQYTLPDDLEKIDKELDKEIEELFYGGELEPPEVAEECEPDPHPTGS